MALKQEGKDGQPHDFGPDFRSRLMELLEGVSLPFVPQDHEDLAIGVTGEPLQPVVKMADPSIESARGQLQLAFDDPIPMSQPTVIFQRGESMPPMGTASLNDLKNTDARGYLIQTI